MIYMHCHSKVLFRLHTFLFQINAILLSVYQRILKRDTVLQFVHFKQLLSTLMIIGNVSSAPNQHIRLNFERSVLIDKYLEYFNHTLLEEQRMENTRVTLNIKVFFSED